MSETVPATPAEAVELDAATRLRMAHGLRDDLHDAAGLAADLDLHRLASILEVALEWVEKEFPPAEPSATVALTVGALVRLVKHPDCTEVGTIASFATAHAYTGDDTERVEGAWVVFPIGLHEATRAAPGDGARRWYALADLEVAP